MSKRVCIVSPLSPACNPRVVKEMDALHEAGYLAHLVCGNLGPISQSETTSLLKRRPWGANVTRLNLSGLSGTMSKAATKIARVYTSGLGGPVPFGVHVARHSSLAAPLAKALKQIDCDLYIGHYLAGLHAAGTASVRKGVPLTFDAEDAHHLELQGKTPAERAELAAISAIEGRWLTHCSALTTAAPMIGESYKARYGMDSTTLLNVFPVQEGPTNPVRLPLESHRVYWFSQKIGPHRGLESLLDILKLSGLPVTLELRGTVSPEYRQSLFSQAAGLPLIFLQPGKPEEMARLAAEYTVGVCTELSIPPHHDVCLANKLFTYLLAGIPTILSSTQSHRAIANELGEAGLLVDLNAREESAAILASFLGDPSRLEKARSVAWSLGRERFNWDIEKSKFLNIVENVLSGRKGVQR